MPTLVLWLLAGSPARGQEAGIAARDVPVLRPTGFVEDLVFVEPDSLAYALALRLRGPGGLSVRIRPKQLLDLGPPPREPLVLKVAPWPMFVGGGLKVGARF